MTGSSASPPPAARLHSGDIRTALALGGLALVLSLLVAAWGVVGTYHDDGVYVASALSLLEGEGYRIASLPDAPLQTKYPPLYPLLIAPLLGLAPGLVSGVVAVQILGAVVAGAVVAGACLYLVRFGYVSRPVAWVTGLLMALSPFFLWHAMIPLTEMSYALVVLAGLWFLERALRAEEQGVGATFGLGLLLGLPGLVRAIGLVAPLGPGLGLVLLGRPRRFLPALAGGLFAVGPWVLWTRSITAGLDAPPSHLYYTSYAGWLANAGVGPVRVFVDNLGTAAIQVGYLVVAPLGMLLEGRATLLLIGLCVWLTLMAVAWLVETALAGRVVVPAFVTAYLAVVLVWPWPPTRFLVPAMPFLIAGMVALVGRLLARWPRAPTVAAAVVAVGAAVHVASYARTVRAHAFPVHPMSDAELAPTWAGYERLFAWVRSETAPDDVLAAPFDPMIYLYTGRHAYRPWVGSPFVLHYGGPGPALGPVEQFGATLAEGGADWFVAMPMSTFAEGPHAESLIGEAVERGWLVEVWRDPEDPRLVAYDVHADRIGNVPGSAATPGAR